MFREVPGQTDYYDRMAEGFKSGHLYIKEAPSPRLLAAFDPYEDQNVRLGLWDASLYKGRYYLYWGPVPALLLLAFKAVSGSTATVSDQWPTLIFMLGRFYAGAALIFALCRARFLRPPAWLVVLAVAAFGLAAPGPFIVARPHVYEACLAAGQCFLLWGMWAALRGITRREARLPLFVLAGGLWALAIGSRVTMLFAVPLLVAITTLTTLLLPRPANGKGGSGWAELFQSALALGLLPTAAIGAYAYYNYARFDSVMEFGVTYQITYQKFWTHGAYVVPNLLSYLWAPLDWSCRFPFAFPLENRPPFQFMSWPPGYLTFERVAGVLVMAPWCYLLLLGAWRLISFCWERAYNPRLSGTAMSMSELWVLLSSFAILPTMIPVLSLWEASMRYSGDALSGVLMASTLGAFWLVRRGDSSRRPMVRWQARGLVVALGLYTCFVGAFSGVASYSDPLRMNNPTLYRWLESTISVCSASS